MKDWWQSKTVWVNLLTLVLSILLFLQGEQWIINNPETVALIGTAIGILNIFLRFLTSTEMVGSQWLKTKKRRP